MYTIHQWLLLFYLYCFAGWIWESCYVSLKKRKWINRGFLKGPLLPIYGSGAIVVLVSTLTVKNNIYYRDDCSNYIRIYYWRVNGKNISC